MHRVRVEDVGTSDDEIKHIALRQIDRILRQHGKSLADYPPMPIPPPDFVDHFGGVPGNSLIRDQWALQMEALWEFWDENLPQLNQD